MVVILVLGIMQKLKDFGLFNDDLSLGLWVARFEEVVHHLVIVIADVFVNCVLDRTRAAEALSTFKTVPTASSTNH